MSPPCRSPPPRSSRNQGRRGRTRPNTHRGLRAGDSAAGDHQLEAVPVLRVGERDRLRPRPNLDRGGPTRQPRGAPLASPGGRATRVTHTWPTGAAPSSADARSSAWPPSFRAVDGRASRSSRSSVCLVLSGLVTASSARAQTAATGAIAVHAVGDRDRVSGNPIPLSGATLRASSDAALTTTVGECVTGADGSCTIGGLPPGTYWIAPAGDPVGFGGAFHAIPGVSTTFGGNVAYAQEVAVTEGDADTRAFAYRRTNPPFPQRCGVRIDLLFDLSGSISAERARDREARRRRTFVDALAGTPSEIAVSTFATAAPAAGNTNLPLTSVQSAAGVEHRAARDRRPGAHAGRRRVHELGRRVPVGGRRRRHRRAVHRRQPDRARRSGAVPARAHGLRAARCRHRLREHREGRRHPRARGRGRRRRRPLVRATCQVVSGPVPDSDYAITTFADVHRVFRALADALCPKPGPQSRSSPSPRS